MQDIINEQIEKILKSKILLIIVLILLVLEIIVLSEINGHFIMTFLDVGQGDSILLKNGMGNFILVDAGESGNVVGNLDKVLPFWQKRLDIAIGTHADSDHIGGLNDILERYDLKMLIINKEGIIDSNLLSILDMSEKKGVKVISLYSGDVIKAGGTRLECLWPTKSFQDDEDNAKSIVFKGNNGNFNFLLTGDIESEQEGILLENDVLEQVLVLKVSHHGSNSSTTEEFLNQIYPKYAIISSGEGNKFGHPSEDVIKKLLEKKIQIFRTDINGSITFRVVNSQMFIQVEK